jgi:hypothetical protein
LFRFWQSVVVVCDYRFVFTISCPQCLSSPLCLKKLNAGESVREDKSGIRGVPPFGAPAFLLGKLL